MRAKEIHNVKKNASHILHVFEIFSLFSWSRSVRVLIFCLKKRENKSWSEKATRFFVVDSDYRQSFVCSTRRVNEFTFWRNFGSILLPCIPTIRVHVNVILVRFYCCRSVGCVYAVFFRSIFSLRTHSHFGFTIFSVLCPHVSFFLSQHSCWVRLCV